MCLLTRYYEARCGLVRLDDGGRWQPVRLLRLSREPCGMHPPGAGPLFAGLAASGFACPPSAGRAEHGGMADHPERWSSPFSQVEMRRLWTYSDGALTAKAYRLPGGTASAGSWVLVDQGTGNVQGVVPPGEFSRRFRPVDVFADVPGPQLTSRPVSRLSWPSTD